MEKFSSLSGVAAPFPLVNVDTDMIIPKQFLRSPSRTGYGKALFHELRFDPQGRERADFVLNRSPFRQARFLVAGANFGCGSSREHAPWALAEFGIRCIVAPSFADIFEGNCFNNGILPIALDPATVQRLTDLVSEPATARLKVDLPRNELTLSTGEVISFRVDAYRRENLLDGRDAIGSTLAFAGDIASFEARHWRAHSWLHPDAANPRPATSS